MSTPKGWPDQEKNSSRVAQFTTIEPVRAKQYGMSVAAHMYVYEVGTDASEANSTTTVINATAHAAIKGDIIRFTAGTLINREFRVYETGTNTITVAEEMPAAPGTDAFQILRSKSPIVNADGSAILSLSPSGLDYIDDAYLDYSVTNVDITNWEEIIAATAAQIERLHIFDSSGRLLELGIGAAASESRILYIEPGGNGRVDLQIPAGSRLAIRAIDADATSGFISITGLG